jgi:hypothetical protein
MRKDSPLNLHLLPDTATGLSPEKGAQKNYENLPEKPILV